MKLSLSCRMVEARNNRPSPMPYEEFLALVKGAGYDALCLRASQGGIYTPLDRLYEMRRLTKESGLRISMVTPDFPVPANTDQAGDCLRHITPYLDVAEIFGSDMIRVGMKKDEDIPWAQRACDEARERKIRLVHHGELHTLFATFDDSMRTLKAVKRPNFGYVHDEAQWMVNSKGYRADQMAQRIRAVAPWLWNVYVKNQRTDKTGCECLGDPELKLDDRDGVDFARMFDALYTIHYSGPITVHAVSAPYGSQQEAARECSRYLRPFANHAAPARTF
jgi:sugar phosphate isomerase/epimerase